MRRFTYQMGLCLTFFAAFILSACANPSLEVDIKYSGFLAPMRTGMGTVYWMDDDTVLFVGAKQGVLESTRDGRKPHKNLLVRWNVSSGKSEIVADLGEAAALCYYEGYVYYSFQRSGVWVFKAGQLGREIEIPRTIRDGGRRFNELTCQEYDYRDVAARIGPGFWPLRDGDGYWGGKGSNSRRTYLVRPDGTERELAIPYAPPPRWSESSRQYYFQQVSNVITSTTTGDFWTIRLDGTVSHAVVPAGPWFRGSVRFVPARPGIVMSSHAVGLYDNGDAGAYLVKDGSVRRFIEGYILGLGVSPSGCRVALSIVLQRGSQDKAEMVIADICSSGE